MNKAPQVSFEALVDTFGMAVRLRMVGGTHSQSDLGKTKELAPKLAGKDGITIGDDMSRQDMNFEDVVEEGLCYSLGYIRMM